MQDSAQTGWRFPKCRYFGPAGTLARIPIFVGLIRNYIDMGLLEDSVKRVLNKRVAKASKYFDGAYKVWLLY